MSESISSLSSVINSIALMRSSEQEIDLLTQQNATGTISTSLAGYGTSASQVLNLDSDITETQSWITGATQVGTYLTGYDASLTELNSDATQLQTALESVGNGTTSGTDTSLSDLQALVKGLEADVGATLNTQVGDRYIFAGNRYDTAPTVDLTQLAVPTTPSAIVLASGSATPPTIPDYDTDYASTSPPGVVASGTPYYAQQTVTISASETVSFGVSADDPSIQQLVYAMQQAEAATTTTSSADSAQFLANAKSAVATAITGLTTLSQQNSGAESTVTNATTLQKTSLSTLQTQLGNLTQVDSATVATELTSVENQLQGTYKATSTLLNLSLLNYLT
jgi:flagellar hook-associated protein 3 FlgL